MQIYCFSNFTLKLQKCASLEIYLELMRRFSHFQVFLTVQTFTSHFAISTALPPILLKIAVWIDKAIFSMLYYIQMDKRL